MLQKQIWPGATKITGIEWARKGVNREVAKFLQEMGGSITHREICYVGPNIYRKDGVELSAESLDIFLANLKGWIGHFLSTLWAGGKVRKIYAYC